MPVDTDSVDVGLPLTRPKRQSVKANSLDTLHLFCAIDAHEWEDVYSYNWRDVRQAFWDFVSTPENEHQQLSRFAIAIEDMAEGNPKIADLQRDTLLYLDDEGSDWDQQWQLVANEWTDRMAAVVFGG